MVIRWEWSLPLHITWSDNMSLRYWSRALKEMRDGAMWPSQGIAFQAGGEASTESTRQEHLWSA